MIMEVLTNIVGEWYVKGNGLKSMIIEYLTNIMPKQHSCMHRMHIE